MDKIQNIQKKIGKMKKDTEGYNYKYFDINQLLEKLTPLLHEEGLTLIQPLSVVGTMTSSSAGICGQKPTACLRTIIYDGEKEILNHAMPLPELTKPQEMGSAITYYRRYSLQSLFALEAEDDDGAITKPIKESKKDYQNNNKVAKDNDSEPF